MSIHTPRRPYMRGPSLGNHNLSATSSPNLAASYQRPPMPSPLSASAIMARKASFNQLTAGSLASVPDNSDSYGLGDSQRSARGTPKTPTTRVVPTNGDGDIEVGDTVNVPGGMYGTIKFIGAVKGKNGVFAGVELSREWASRGKNDGAVDGTRYFTTSVRGAGIFLPLSRATKRASPTASTRSFLGTPTTPSVPGFNAPNNAELLSQSTPSVPKFSQSVGPGRGPSPQFKPKSRRLSLPRPESPLRQQQNLLPTPRQPSLGASVSSNSGIRGPRYAPSPTPGRFGASVRGRRESNSADPSKRPTVTPKAGPRSIMSPPPPQASSRSVSRASRASQSTSRQSEGFAFEDDFEGTPIGVARTNDSAAARSASALSNRLTRTSTHTADELARMKLKLEERDRQLKEQSSTLAEMESSLIELQSLLPTQDSDMVMGVGPGDNEAKNADVAQLRAILREKNEKIALITAEFDAHRADFRSTIDTLELASAETERVYEKRVEELLQEVRELNERNEDVESVALQLKQLEELVQELEEGLEDARRGEAEARGEVEFLRGEVERGRSELRRERDKAATALKSGGAVPGAGPAAAIDGRISARDSKEVEQKDDEIRGLKAIIHSLSRDSVMSSTEARSPQFGDGEAASSQEREHNLRLQEQLDEERAARDRLEHELVELRGLFEHTSHREEELELALEQAGSDAKAQTQGLPASSHVHNETLVPEFASASTPAPAPAPAPASSAKRPSQPVHIQYHEEAEDDDNNDNDVDSTRRPRPMDNDALWCEICETAGHDILTCTNVFGSKRGDDVRQTTPRPLSSTSSSSSRTPRNSSGSGSGPGQRNGMAAVVEGLRGLALSPPLPHPPSHPPASLSRDQSHPSHPLHALHPQQQHHHHHHQQHPPRSSSLGERDPGLRPIDKSEADSTTEHRAEADVAPLSISPKKQRAPSASVSASPSAPFASASAAAAPATSAVPAQAPAGSPHADHHVVDSSGMVAGKSSGVINPDKWCALCEQDGHESVDCPLEDAFA
ncbi:hypothetical protein L228DRAFT_264385 [Xylona heveae TC161]|uniref:CAP-Gly domain-containing protein n=1 Tax=Xylona heveae (strain CBS 132557 / TC161) TaxID=1328760 RepID=A0A165J9U0_XYLHT|nr:hypothetical protein L228DRAFT_264385 [Xylona heveae TC161]KZF25947.1 hypothetical protein L228DRAFT_264385 [Xylona heveae TC161]